MEHKMVVLGDMGVGKSALVIQLVCGHFVDQYDPTIEDSYRKQVVVDGETCLIDVLDTAGGEEFAPMRELYLKNTQAYIIVYDITSRASFDSVLKIQAEIAALRPELPKLAVIIVGNKADLMDKRVVQSSEGKALADSFGYPFFETSCKDRVNTDLPFDEAVREIRKLFPSVNESSSTSWKNKVLKMLHLKKTDQAIPPPPKPEVNTPVLSITDEMEYTFNHREEFSDLLFTFSNPERVIYAHRIIICCRSKVLREKVLAAVQKDDKYLVDMSQVDYDAFSAIIEYLYTGKINKFKKILDDEDKQKAKSVENIDKLAVEYELTHLVSMCEYITSGMQLESTELVQKSQEHLAEQLKSCFTTANKYSAATSDISVIVEGEAVKLHRVILVSRSAYFKRLLRSGMKETVQKEIQIDDASKNAFIAMIRFLYSPNECYITPDTVQELLMLSHKYAIQPLFQCCEKLLSQALDATNIFSMFELAKKYEAAQLLSVCVHYLVTEFDTIFKNFPVMKDLHKQIKEEIKKYPHYVAYLKHQSKYWDSHSAIYVPPADGGWKKYLGFGKKKHNKDKDEE